MRTPIQAGKIKQTRSRYMSTNVILKEGIHCLLFVTLAQSYVSIHLEGMNVISLLLDIGHEMKKIVLASPFLSQVILDFCLTLFFSTAVKPRILVLRLWIRFNSALERALAS
jgi:hypothetical protein